MLASSIVNNIYSMDHMTFNLRLEKEKEEEYQAKWITDLTNKESDN